MRLVFNLIHRGTRPMNQEQNGLPPVVRLVEISEESQSFSLFATCHLSSAICLTPRPPPLDHARADAGRLLVPAFVGLLILGEAEAVEVPVAQAGLGGGVGVLQGCLLYTSPSPRDS